MAPRRKAKLRVASMPREDVAHILRSFKVPSVGVLREFDSMGAAIRNGGVYRSRLDPPPGDPRAAHQPRAEKCSLCGKQYACCGARCHGCVARHGEGR